MACPRSSPPRSCTAAGSTSSAIRSRSHCWASWSCSAGRRAGCSPRLISIVCSGLAAWFLTPVNTLVLGASGLIFGWLTYLDRAGDLVPPDVPGRHRGSGPALLRRADLGGVARSSRGVVAGPSRRGRRRRVGCLAASSAVRRAAATRDCSVRPEALVSGPSVEIGRIVQAAPATPPADDGRERRSLDPAVCGRRRSARTSSPEVDAGSCPNVPAEPASWWAERTAASRWLRLNASASRRPKASDSCSARTRFARRA